LSKKTENENDPRSKRTRRLLQDSLSQLMHTKTFNEISVQDITAVAEVNRATFYAHYEDKYDLLNARIRSTFQNLLDEKLPEKPMFTLENLCILSETAHNYLAAFAGHCAVSSIKGDNGLMVQQVHRQMNKVILEWLEHSPITVPPSAPPLEVVAITISWAMFGSILEGSWHGRKLSSGNLTTQVLSLLEPGLRTYLVAEAAH
jgi:AcrR family transcriptional regulator